MMLGLGRGRSRHYLDVWLSFRVLKALGISLTVVAESVDKDQDGAGLVNLVYQYGPNVLPPEYYSPSKSWYRLEARRASYGFLPCCQGVSR